MGACMSSNTEEVEKKKRSQVIDKKLEEDSRRIRRECKILLLGRWCIGHLGAGNWMKLIIPRRLRREWKIDDCQTDEDHTPEWLHCGRTGHVSIDHLQESHRLRQSPDWGNAAIRD